MLAPVSPGFAEINKKGEENTITSKTPKPARSPINGERYFYALKGGADYERTALFHHRNYARRLYRHCNNVPIADKPPARKGR